MSVRSIEAEVYIQSGVEADVEIGREIVKTVYEEPVLESLSVTSNGTYEPEGGVDGYSDVTVNVPGKIPVLEQLRAIANGEYYPAEGVDGFDEVLVDVPSNLKDAYVCEGTFTATQDGIFELDTSYEGEGDPHIMIIWADKNIRSDEFLEKAPPYALNVYSALKRTASKPSYAVTNYLNGQCYTNYSYENDSNEYNISYGSTALILSRSEPNYGAGKALRFYDNRNMRLFMASEPSEETPTVPYFATGITYRYYVVYDEPQPVTPKDPNIVEGEFIGTEVGTLRVNIPYDGDTFPKMIIVYVEGECLSTTGDFIVNANLHAINACQLLKIYATTPSYSGNSNPNFARLVVSYKGSNSGYSQSALSCYNYNQGSCNYNADCLKFRDNKTMDVFIQTERNPTTGGIFFMKDIRYKYQVFY